MADDEKIEELIKVDDKRFLVRFMDESYVIVSVDDIAGLHRIRPSEISQNQWDERSNKVIIFKKKNGDRFTFDA